MSYIIHPAQLKVMPDGGKPKSHFGLQKKIQHEKRRRDIIKGQRCPQMPII